MDINITSKRVEPCSKIPLLWSSLPQWLKIPNALCKDIKNTDRKILKNKINLEADVWLLELTGFAMRVLYTCRNKAQLLLQDVRGHWPSSQCCSPPSAISTEWRCHSQATAGNCTAGITVCLKHYICLSQMTKGSSLLPLPNQNKWDDDPASPEN